ncbi:MAG: DUF499 domain-containing protein [Myxococcales bacterium]|nr:DUF499 domain-containing protein [Myxococcales bacterium]
MEPWYRVCTLRKEVREGRSFNPDEFAIALEQVVAGTAPEDYRDPVQFFARTCFTRALRQHCAMVLQRLAGRTASTAPVLTLITQFGGGKTHTLTALYHLAKHGEAAASLPGVADMLREAGLAIVPKAKVAVFVGNAWDPKPGVETPWIDLALQLAGEAGVAALGPAAKTTAPGTEAISRLFAAADAPVLVLFDEVLNYINRHRAHAEPFHAFIQNLTVAATSITHGACVVSLPRSQVEMTDWDVQWQDRIAKVVRRVARDLIVNDEAEIAEVVRRRLFEDLGGERTRRHVARQFADWCFERRAQLPPEWTAVDSAATEAKAREQLARRFEASYPFHPATLSVFQRKWQSLPQYQQTRGTLAMLAQWVALAAADGFRKARNEPLITLGSAPLDEPGFRSVVLGQLGESRLVVAIEADIAGEHAHARALDADHRGPLRDIHRRVGTAILCESSGGQTDKSAHLPELRFALGEPGLDTTSIDNAATALQERAYYVRRVGTDGFRIGHQFTLKKVVNDRRASLDEEKDVKPAVRKLVEEQFRRGAPVPVVTFPADGADVPDGPRLTLVVVDPDRAWTGGEPLRAQIAEWTKRRGNAPRLYPAALVWCVKKPGRELQEKVELELAWKRVEREVAEGVLGDELGASQREELRTSLREAGEAARDEVWASYRYVVLADPQEPDGLRVLDLGAGHVSAHVTLGARVLAALQSEALVSASIGAGYLDRNWPPALRASGAWALPSLRQSFLDGSLTRLENPEAVLRAKIVELVQKGEFGLASGPRADGGYDRVWFEEPLSPDEVAFEPGLFLLRRDEARRLKSGAAVQAPLSAVPGPEPARDPRPFAAPSGTAEQAEIRYESGPSAELRTLRVRGRIPSESWNRLGVRLWPKLRTHAQGGGIDVGVDFTVKVSSDAAQMLVTELRTLLDELQMACQARSSDPSAAGASKPRAALGLRLWLGLGIGLGIGIGLRLGVGLGLGRGRGTRIEASKDRGKRRGHSTKGPDRAILEVETGLR